MAFDATTDEVIAPGWDERFEERVELERRLAAERQSRRRRELARKRRRARIRRNRCIAALIVVALAAGVWAVFPGGHAPADAARHPQLTSHFQPARRVFTVPGALGPITWPRQGQGAVATLGGGLMAASAKERSVPIASLTKMMTAYVVLHDHPLALGDEGPQFTMTGADVAAWVHASQTDESNAPVQLGEVLSEHQLLEALLLPSADNIADRLAQWDAGSMSNFVKKMNATARSLGLGATHYTDASGVDPRSRSDAGDQAQLAALLMSDPVVRSIVSHPSLAFPVAGTIRNYNPALGVDGIIGVKSGFTSHAQGCLATAAYRKIAGHSVLVVAVALGQPNGLSGAADAAEKLIDSGTSKLVPVRPASAGATLGSVSIGGAAAIPVTLQGVPPVMVGWPGMKIHELISLAPAVASGARSATSGGSLGQVVFATTAGVLTTAPIVGAGAPATS